MENEPLSGIREGQVYYFSLLSVARLGDRRTPGPVHAGQNSLPLSYIGTQAQKNRL